jgi:hypothetical protein
VRRAIGSYFAERPSRSKSSRRPIPRAILNGAVVAGLKELDAHLDAEGKPVALGTPGRLWRGPDLAGRVTAEALAEELGKSQAGIIGIGVEAETPYLDFAQNGVFRAGNPAEMPNAVPIAFEEAGLAHHEGVPALLPRRVLHPFARWKAESPPRSRVQGVKTAKSTTATRASTSTPKAFSGGCNPENPADLPGEELAERAGEPNS